MAQSLKSLSDRNDSSSTYSNGIKDLVGMIHNSGEGTKDRNAPLQETKRGGSFTEALLNTCQICEGMNSGGTPVTKTRHFHRRLVQ